MLSPFYLFSRSLGRYSFMMLPIEAKILFTASGFIFLNKSTISRTSFRFESFSKGHFFISAEKPFLSAYPVSFIIQSN